MIIATLIVQVIHLMLCKFTGQLCKSMQQFRKYILCNSFHYKAMYLLVCISPNLLTWHSKMKQKREIQPVKVNSWRIACSSSLVVIDILNQISRKSLLQIILWLLLQSFVIEFIFHERIMWVYSCLIECTVSFCIQLQDTVNHLGFEKFYIHITLYCILVSHQY